MSMIPLFPATQNTPTFRSLAVKLVVSLLGSTLLVVMFCQAARAAYCRSVYASLSFCMLSGSCYALLLGLHYGGLSDQRDYSIWLIYLLKVIEITNQYK